MPSRTSQPPGTKGGAYALRGHLWSLNDLDGLSPLLQGGASTLGSGVGGLTEVDENGVLLRGQLLQELFVGHVLWLLFTGKWMFKVELLS